MMKRSIIFVLLTFAATWALAFWLMFKGDFNNTLLVQLVFSVFMLIPALMVIATRLITKEGFKDMMLHPRFKGNIAIYILAWFGPSLLTALGAVLYYFIFPQYFDPEMGLVTKQILTTYGIGSLNETTLRNMLLVQILSGVFLGPALNIIFALGEELGWRGYLLPHLCSKFKVSTSIIISGFIWGLWHAPMIAMGHNYGKGYTTYPWGGILAMIAFCIFAGAFFSWMTLKSGSAIPAALAHGGLNSLAAAGTMFLAEGAQANPFIGPAPTGIIGGLGYIVAGIVFFLACKGSYTGNNHQEPGSNLEATEWPNA